MARMPRKFVVDDDEVGVYHCINRCVRRAFLCGTDEVSGQCFDHRKQFIQDRLEFLAGVFRIDVLAFAVMSNHLHVVLRNRRLMLFARGRMIKLLGGGGTCFPRGAMSRRGGCAGGLRPVNDHRRCGETRRDS